MIDRRRVLSSMAATGMVASLPGAGAQSAPGRPPAHAPPPGPRMNFDQADRVLAELELDALVLGNGVNFRHATGLSPGADAHGPPARLAGRGDAAARPARWPWSWPNSAITTPWLTCTAPRVCRSTSTLQSRWPAEEERVRLTPSRWTCSRTAAKCRWTASRRTVCALPRPRCAWPETGAQPGRGAGAGAWLPLTCSTGRIAVDGPAVAAALAQAAPKAATGRCG